MTDTPQTPSEWIYARMKALGKPATTDTVSTEMRAILDWLDSRFS